MLKLKSVLNLLISKNIQAFYKHTNYLLGRNNRHDILKKILILLNIYQTKLAVISVNILLLFLKFNNNNTANFLQRYHLKSTIDDIFFYSDNILKVIHGMNDTMSHGPDNISCFLIEKIATLLALPLSLLFHLSLHEGKLPDVWKTACRLSSYKGNRKDARDEIL